MKINCWCEWVFFVDIRRKGCVSFVVLFIYFTGNQDIEKRDKRILLLFLCELSVRKHLIEVLVEFHDAGLLHNNYSKMVTLNLVLIGQLKK